MLFILEKTIYVDPDGFGVCARLYTQGSRVHTHLRAMAILKI